MLPVLVDTDLIFLPTYLVLNSIGFTIAIFWAYKRAKTFGYNQNDILDIALVVMIAGFIGARLLHVLWEQPQHYFDNPLAVFEFWQGGFVFYGGAFTAFIAAFVFTRIRKIDWKKAADIGAPVFALGYATGRLGCFAAGCCFGRPTHLPWGVIFPHNETIQLAVHPTQLYAVFWAVVGLFLILNIEKKWTSRQAGQLFGVWVVWHGLGRMIMEKFRDDFRGPTMFNLSLGTTLSFVVVAFGIYLIIGQKKSHASTST